MFPYDHYVQLPIEGVNLVDDDSRRPALDDDQEQPLAQDNTGGAMLGHIQRYKAYISDLKKGNSSGISAAFGRASDLLPPEVMQVAPPAAKSSAKSAVAQAGSAAPAPALDEVVFASGADTTQLRASVEELIAECATELENPVGETLDTPYGELKVDEVFVEGSRRTFMLSDLRVIDEAEYLRWRRVPDSTATEGAARPVSVPFGGDRAPDLSVTTPAGNLLWNVYFNGYDAEKIAMFDGTFIGRAEGRDEMVLALRVGPGQTKAFILSGLMVDPTTGNVFAEANQGAFTAGFLNTGWRVFQYRTREHGDLYYVSEPPLPDCESVTIQVNNLSIDMETGAVSYETTDSAAVVTLRSRRLN